MAWQKYRFRRTPDEFSTIIPARRSRIFIPQPPTRPIDIHQKDLLKKQYVRAYKWWFSLRRKGVKREKVGEDPLEKRAVPKELVRGTLPERILYNALVTLLHMTPNVDFDFQSSQAGGRIELGGLVADFLFPLLAMVIQVQGPTHSGFLRGKKDEEQKAILNEMGYTVFDVEDTLIYDELRFENWLRMTFNLGGVGGGGGSSFPTQMQSSSGVTRGMVAVQSNNDSLGASDEATAGLILSVLQEIQDTIRSHYA